MMPSLLWPPFHPSQRIAEVCAVWLNANKTQLRDSKLTIVFVFVALVTAFVGRKLGWTISKRLIYRTPLAIALLITGCWGLVVGLWVHIMIATFHPGRVSKWIFGFALGAYVSNPSFGLFDESTMPNSVMLRHRLISTVSLVVFVGILFAGRAMR